MARPEVVADARTAGARARASRLRTITSKPQIAVGLDAGSCATRCLVGLLENSRLRLIGYGQSESRGWAKGHIIDQQALAESIRSAVSEAEESAGVQVASAVVGMGGSGIRGVNNRALYPLGRPREIDEDDVKNAVEAACQIVLPAERIVLQMFPQDFAVDGRAEYRNPRGAIGSRLESFVHLITATAQEHQCLVGAVNRASIEVEETVFEAFAAAYASALPEDRTEGLAVVDIGGHSTEMAVFYGEILLLATTLPISGDHFTRDVSHGLCVTHEEAQRLKEECGCALLGLTGDNSIIEVPSPEGRPPREAPRRDLNRILQARAQELFRYVKRELASIGVDQALSDGIVLTGSASILNGMCDMAERVLNCQARNGLIIGIQDWPDEIDNPAWTTAAGLLMYSARLKYQTEQKRQQPGLLGRLFG